MSCVVDHTLLSDHASGGAYLSAAIARYLQLRHMLVVPVPSVLAAATAHPRASERLAWLLHDDLQAVIKIQEITGADAITIASTVGHQPTPDPAEYALQASVVWAARNLQLPVLTFHEKAYEPYGVATRRTP